jgi:curved DNA-binding protein CbpA
MCLEEMSRVEQLAQWETGHPVEGSYSVTWALPGGFAGSAEVCAVDQSDHGMRIDSPEDIPVGQQVFIHGSDLSGRHAVVCHCTAFGERFHIGLEFGEETKAGFERQSVKEDSDYYEVLQINPKAESDTVHRVYRLMAMRFHPDNPETGNLETFLQLKRAFEVLSDPEQRATYDASRASQQSGPLPVFELRDFVDGVQGEVNRRLGVLCLLYNRRRTDPDHPGISLLDLETRMGFPREYLNFTMWYLRSKNFVTAADNSDYALTADGADYVETHTSESEPLSKLISGGFWSPPKTTSSQPYEMPQHRLIESPSATAVYPS